MASLWERAAHSVNNMFSLLCCFSHFDVEGGNLVLIAPVPDHCLTCNF